MVIGMPTDPTLMELRIAGWTVEEIARTYGVSELSVRGAFVQHFRRNAGLVRKPVHVSGSITVEIEEQ